MNKPINFFFQFVFDQKISLTNNRSFLSRLKEKIIYKIFSLISKLGDPLVMYRVGNYDLLFPFSHKMPFYLKAYPQHSSNLARIAAQVKQKYHKLTFLDIGANVGDTVAILRTKAEFPILSIEGNERYFKILEKNIINFTNVEIAKEFVGEDSVSFEGEIKEKEGTASLAKSRLSNHTIYLKKLSDILREKKDFCNSKMLKIDTDGFDCRILMGSSDFLSNVKPVIFFEYEPLTLSLHDDNGFSVFEFLRKFGYKSILIYDDIGYFLLSAELADASLIEELDLYLRGYGRGHYFDICVFHDEDSDLSKKIRNSEVEFFNKISKC